MTTDSQVKPDVQIQSNGGFIVVWSGPFGTGEGIHARLYDAGGVPADPEFEVHAPAPTYRSTTSRVATSSPGGEFLVTWREYSDPLNGEIRARLYSPTGAPLGNSFQVNSYETSDQREPAVAARGDGGFAVVWTSYGSPGTDTLGGSVQARLVDSAGLPLGGQFQVNEFTNRTQRVPSVEASPDGGFIVAWFGGTLSFSVEARRFGTSGSPLGPQFEVNGGENNLTHTALAVGDDGTFVVAWRKRLFYAYHLSVAQVVSPDDEPLGAFTIDTEDEYGGLPGIAAAADPVSDEFLIVFQNFESILGTRSSKTGVPLGDNLILNGESGSRAQLDTDAAGDMVVVWQGEAPGTDDDGSGIVGRRFLGSHVFVDGFESGDTTAWSNTVP